MKIVIDARESGTSTGRYVDKLVEYLHKLKPAHELVILTKKHRLDFMNQIAPSFTIVRCDHKEFSFDEQLGFNKQLDNLAADLVHFAMPQQPILYDGQVVTTFHDLITARFDNPAKNKLVFKVKQSVYKFVLKKAAHKSAHLIAISQYTKNDVADFAKVPDEKISVIYEAADKIEVEPEPLTGLIDKKFLLFVGRPNPHKNLERLIKAMTKVRKEHPEIMLALAGKNDKNYERLKKLVEKNNLTDQVYFTGFVSDAQLRWLYENALAYVFPSLYEGFGLPGLEAMCYSLPVISSNATCLPEIYKDAVLYFDPTDGDDMAAKILRVANDPALRHELAAKGDGLVRTYSWEKMAKETLAVYEQALK